MHKKNLYIAGAVVCSAVLGFAGGYFLKPAPRATFGVRENTTEYKFIHPLLLVARPDIDTPSPEYESLSRSVNKYISSEKQSGNLETASVLFIDYGKNGSFAINADETYAPASLLKVVIMVAYLKKADMDLAILSKKLFNDPSLAESLEAVPFQMPSTLSVGGSYDISTLINKMIIDSDNGAMNILLANIDDDYLTQVYRELGLHGPETPSGYTISAKDYSVFFRVLYNGTYLSNENSEKALSILSKATFDSGLVAGLPQGTTVAHKFGEHVNGTGDRIDSIELHDCGITYTDRGPYLLCVMTKGKTLTDLEKAIATISKMAYEAVSEK